MVLTRYQFINEGIPFYPMSILQQEMGIDLCRLHPNISSSFQLLE